MRPKSPYMADYVKAKRYVSSIRQYSYGYKYACQTWRRHLQYVAIHTSDVTSKANTNARYVISKQDQIIQMVLNTPDVFLRRTPPPDNVSASTMSDLSYTSAVSTPDTIMTPAAHE
ncbi:hypothetical protein GLOIN_2v1842374 [Rhizophagus irregularis DAOM 181602=DAOM 197198]|uniref:Uncharacterized protein n=1 Tax=Rhizophagus irregularis (strain DAOM 181602 / DAOM 197198 / MUCL 43194) TaxID=747089 RepID=U9U6P0_RHIID|nr:hypothetical protein GLOIN_2v1842374 [Rhizophagus irregularis DAOM 181602=DAOM 197198]POG69466.1 hypothetical protein GLOIN_2v1842374 [Rhizophagus irregularis DAOM 181602=DAOM 197198]GBC32264.1 hypothetical protein GLOIN_2v1842374 [Rhizophagus irregularis DAOM 181602=DAOM 197198]|eukprot:XP_025176332.1 hypothetical protein GLOIN_2v1842374 [Rhizophagus irregularis DAOM 181602=DAOM 197198]